MKISYSTNSPAQCGPCSTITKKDFGKLAFINTVGLAVLSLMSFALAREYQSTKLNNRNITLLQLGMAALTRFLIEANIAILKKGEDSQFFVEKLMNFLTRFSFEGYEIIYNASINFYTTSIGVQQVFTAVIQAWIGFIGAGQLTNFLKLVKLNVPDVLPVIDQGIVNPLLGPDYYHLKGKVPLSVLSTVGGVGAVAVGQIYQELLGIFGDLLIRFGSFFSTFGVGFLATQLFFDLWKRREEEHAKGPTNFLESPVGGHSPSWALRVCRLVGRASQRAAGVALIVLGKFAYPITAFGAAGVLGGSLTFQSQQNFQTKNKQILQLSEAESFKPGTETKRTEVKINQLATGAFFLLFFTWFSYGLVVSPKNEAIELGVLIGSTAGSAVLGRMLRRFFEPGVNSALFNEICFLLLNNPFLLMAFYEMLTQLVKVGTGNLNGSSKGDDVVRLFAVFFLGISYGTNQIKPFQLVPFIPLIAVAIFLDQILTDLAGP